MTPDPLSPVLSQLAITGSVFSRAELRAPWGVRTRGTPTAIFHVVRRGAGFAQALDAREVPVGPAVAFRSGDLLLFPHGDAHALTDQPGGETRPIAMLAAPPSADGLACIRADGGGPETSLLCGTLRFDPWAAELVLGHLPRLLHVPGDGATAAWMDATLRMLGAEVGAAAPGAAAVVARLAEVLFIHAVRSWVTRAPAGTVGWLGALADPGLTAALAAMHAQPERGWSVADLARHAGMSRSAFSARFRDAVGVPPMTHLTRWRLAVARQALVTSDDGLAAVAERCGYRSEAAFIRAFQREVGESPTRWRRRQAA